MIRLLTALAPLVALLVVCFAVLFEPARVLAQLRGVVTLGRDLAVWAIVEPLRAAFRLTLLADQRGMLFQRINRSSPEKVFVAVKNNYSTAAITVGQAVQWDFTGAADGVSVTRPTARATNAGMATAGAVAEASIASSGYGLVQVYGYNANLRVRTATGGSPAMAAGSPLCVNAAGSVFCFESISTASTVILKFPCGFAITASTGWTTAVRAGFLKCM